MVWGVSSARNLLLKQKKTTCGVHFGSWFERVVSMMVGKSWCMGIEADVWDSSDLSGSGCRESAKILLI